MLIQGSDFLPIHFLYTYIHFIHFQFAPDDSYFYFGTTTGDVFAIVASSQVFRVKGPKDAFNCGVRALRQLPSGEFIGTRNKHVSALWSGPMWDVKNCSGAFHKREKNMLTCSDRTTLKTPHLSASQRQWELLYLGRAACMTLQAGNQFHLFLNFKHCVQLCSILQVLTSFHKLFFFPKNNLVLRKII